MNWYLQREGGSSTPAQSKKGSDYILPNGSNVLAKTAGWIYILSRGNCNNQSEPEEKKDISYKSIEGKSMVT